jgi:hypothetical protein
MREEYVYLSGTTPFSIISLTRPSPNIHHVTQLNWCRAMVVPSLTTPRSSANRHTHQRRLQPVLRLLHT